MSFVSHLQCFSFSTENNTFKTKQSLANRLVYVLKFLPHSLYIYINIHTRTATHLVDSVKYRKDILLLAFKSSAKYDLKITD